MAKWNISARTVKGGGFKAFLAGCYITTNTAGTAYQFVSNGGTVLATTTGTTLPTGEFDFPGFVQGGGPSFLIHVSSLTTTQVTGTWTGFSGGQTKKVDPESGTWTAQAGSGADGDEPETAASTAA